MFDMPDTETVYTIIRHVTQGWSYAWQLVYMFVFNVALGWLHQIGATLFEDGSFYSERFPEVSGCLDYLGWGCQD